MRSLPSASLALLLGLGSLGALAPTAAPAQIGIGVSVGFAPPPLPVYYQPPIPGYGYIWTPGYWAWDPGFRDYYWAPGLWVRPPGIGLLWTPGYWGWQDGVYLFNAGYWGPTVGFYGGINYGFGYGGFGYAGGQWRGGRLFYNAAANNMTGFRGANVYRQAVSSGPGGRVSFNGGTGGVHAAPTAAQLAVAHQSHIGATAVQRSHLRAAAATPGLRFKANHGAPAAALATAGSPHAGSAARAGTSRTAGEARTQAHATSREGAAVRERGSARATESMARSSREEGRPAGRTPGVERGGARGGEPGGLPRRPEMGGPAMGGPAGAPRGAERGPAGGGQGGGPEERKREGGPH